MKVVYQDSSRSAHPVRRLREVFSLRTISVVLSLAAVYLIFRLATETLSQPLTFDDAYMFLRYAVHLRHGLGVSWNLDAVHTGGMTSLGWFFAVIPLAFLPLDQGRPLAMESFCVGIAGLVLLAFCVTRLAESAPLKRFSLVFPVIALLLLRPQCFRYNLDTGMDTMLSFAMDAALCCGIWALCKASDEGWRWPAAVGLLGACSVIVRPENGLLAVLAPLAASFLLLGGRRRLQGVWTLLSFVLIMTFCVGLYRLYFHAWLPLSFYMKSQHPYRGYTGASAWRPEHFLSEFLTLVLPFLLVFLLCSSRRSLRIAIIYLLPVACTFAYLKTVMQIMGSNARYYIPFTAPVVVAAFWMTDLSLQEGWRRLIRERVIRVVAAGAVLLLLAAATWPIMVRWSKRRTLVQAYPAPVLATRARTSLPTQPWFKTISVLASEIIRPLPAGSVVAASEVGLIGASAPSVDVIDLAGLNDLDIALQGFRMDRLLDRKPVLIWFPHSDYTWQRQVMFCSPRLLEEYEVIGGNAFNYSIAIRRGSPLTAQVEASVDHAFRQLYPGAAMSDYIVSSIHCP